MGGREHEGLTGMGNQRSLVLLLGFVPAGRQGGYGIVAYTKTRASMMVTGYSMAPLIGTDLAACSISRWKSSPRLLAARRLNRNTNSSR